MTSDPGTAKRAPRWQVLLYVAYLWTVRHALQYRVLPLGWAIWMTTPFYEAAVNAGIWPDDAPVPAEVAGSSTRGERAR